MIMQIRSALVCVAFGLILKTCLAQLKYFNAVPVSHGLTGFSLPAESISQLSAIPISPSNYSPRRSAASYANSAKYGSQPTIVAIPLYIRNPSPSKAPIFFDILSASVTSDIGTKGKQMYSKSKPLLSKQSISEISNKQQQQYHNSVGYNGFKFPSKHEAQRYDHSKGQDYLDPSASSGTYNSITSQGLDGGSIGVIGYSSHGSFLQNSPQSNGKIIFPKSPVPQHLTVEDGPKNGFTDFNTALDGYEISKLTNSQTLYDAGSALSQSYNGNSKKLESVNNGGSSYGVASNIGQSYGSSGAESASYSASIERPYYGDTPSGGSTRYGLSGTSNSYGTSSGSGSGFVPSNTGSGYSGDGNFGGSYGGTSGGSGSSYSNSGSQYGSSPGSTSSYGSGNSAQYSNPSSSNYGSSIGSGPSFSSGSTYGNSGGTRSYGSGSPYKTHGGSGSHQGSYGSTDRDAKYASSGGDNSYGSGGYGSQTNGYGTQTGGGYGSQGNEGYNSGQGTSGGYSPSSGTSTSYGSGPSSGGYGSQGSSYSAPTNSGYGSTSGSYSPASSGEYYSSSDDDCSTDSKSLQSNDYAAASAQTLTTISDSQKQLTSPKTPVYSIPTLTSGLTGYESDELDPSKLDLKIVHLPVSVLKRLVGNGELALPSFHQ